MKTLLAGLSAGIIALLVNLLIVTVAVRVTGVPRTFPPFTFLPLLAGSLGGALLAAGAFAVVRVVADRPDRAFLFLMLGCLALSYGLPLRLSWTRSPRFAGVTPAAQSTLVLMHTVVAVASTILLTRYAYRPEP